jgi:hypothetical protein
VPEADLLKKHIWHQPASDLAEVSQKRFILKNYQSEDSTVPGYDETSGTARPVFSSTAVSTLNLTNVDLVLDWWLSDG